MPEARAAGHGKLDDTVVALGIGIFLLAFRSWWRTSHRNFAAVSVGSGNARPEQQVVGPGRSKTTTATETGREGQSVHGRKVTPTGDEPRGGHVENVPRTASTSEPRHLLRGWLSKVFELTPAGLNWPRGVMILDVVLVPLVVVWALGYEQYLLSAVFGVLIVAVADPGGGYGYRVSHFSVVGLVGAGLTALGFGIGGSDWGWLVGAASGVTLVAGLAMRFGIHRFVAAFLLNVWFLIALSVGFILHHHARITSYTWAQVAAWAAGSALWIAVTLVAWLVLGRKDRPEPVAEIPGDISPRKLTPPLIMFAVIRALAIAGGAAIAFGLDLSYGYWVLIAAIVAMRPSLEQSTVAASQRVAGALIGAGAAVLLLLIPANEHGLKLFAVERGLEVVGIVLLMHAASIRFWNYTFYYAALSAAVLILVDLPRPSDYTAEGDRVLWALCGAGIGMIVMLLAGLLAKRVKRGAKAPPQPAPQPA